ncbi:MAG: alpha-2-macroglobulin family protein, partial [Segatella copri]
VQVGSSENGAHIVYSIIAGNKLLEKGAWELGDSIVTLPFTYKEEYASGVVINYSFVKNGECYARTISIARPLPEKKLNIAWKTFRDRLTPGQKEKWTLQITTPDGKPAKAQLMSVLYDKSLDQLAEHSWRMSLGFSQWLPSCYWRSNLKYYTMDLLGIYPTKYYDEKQLDVDKFDGKFFSYYAYMQAVELSKLERSYGGTVEAVRIQKDEQVRNEAKVMRIRGSKMTRFGAASSKPLLSEMDLALQNKMVMLEEFGGGGSNKVLSSADEAALNHVQVRENLNETAFFYPALESDNNGNVAIRFTLPESVTTWKFMGLAHDKEMRNGLLVDEAVAQKTVMVQPNMPRFLREGDKSTIVVKLFNTSDKKVSGNARMQILDPETNKVVWQKTQNYSIDAEGSATISFDVQGLKEGVYINKVVAAGNGYSDGEQHYLPVLSNRELVVNTLPITLHQKGEQNFDLSKLFLNKEGKQAKGAEEAKVTIEYTNNPSWLMVKALPAISNPDEEDAISLMSAIYANTITTHIQKTLSLDNHSQKTLSQETIRLQNQVEKLKKLQNADGSFSWWNGMKGSRYMTTSVAEMMVRLNAVAGVQKSTAKMLTSAIDYLSWQTAQEVREMKKQEEKKQKVSPSEQTLHYLYILSMDGRKMKQNLEADKAYLLDKMSKMTGDFTIYGKARAAVVLARNSQQNAAYREKAGEYLQSVNEYAVYREEMGRYYDTRKALYSWRNYKIPTQVSVIEALQMLKPNDKQTIEELQR